MTATIAVLATCFNRRDTTLRGLSSLRGAANGLSYHVYLVDDASTDGTGDAVRQGFPEATVFTGNGSLYWNGGMRKAWQASLPAEADYYLLWNDDLDLLPDALSKLLAMQQELEAKHGPRVISIGKVADPDTGETTYGGYVRKPGLSRLAFDRVPEGGTPCVTMNGNCVLIPAIAVEELGILSDRFVHDAGDIDYGLRASRAGYRIVQSPFVVGFTPFNDQFLEKKSRLTFKNYRFIFTHPKGIPVDEWLYFCRAHGGWIWPVNFFIRYIKIMRLGA